MAESRGGFNDGYVPFLFSFASTLFSFDRRLFFSHHHGVFFRHMSNPVVITAALVRAQCRFRCYQTDGAALILRVASVAERDPREMDHALRLAGR